MRRNPLNWLLTQRAARRLRGDFVWLTPRLVQGGSFDSNHARSVAAMGIGSVLDLRWDEAHDTSALADAGLTYYHRPLPEPDAPTPDQLEDGVRWALAEMAGGRAVLVHCKLGRSRSPCMACAILVGQGHTLGDALSVVKKARPTTLLTDGQLSCLQTFAARRSGPIEDAVPTPPPRA